VSKFFVLALLGGLVAAGPALGAPGGVRTAVPRDDAAHPGPGGRTEWWFANAIDPRSGLAVAVALGADFPQTPPASVAFLYLPDGSAHVLVAPRLLGRRVSAERPDVRLPPDRLWSPRPGVWRVRAGMEQAIAVHGGSPGPVEIDLTMRAENPGFVAGPLRLPAGQNLSWAVPAPRARVSGTVRVGPRTYRLAGVPGYRDHNFGAFDLADPAHGGWDWSQVHLPGGRSLATGVVRPADPALTGGAAVLSGRGGRLGVARAGSVRVRRAAWRFTGGYAYPAEVRLDARLSGGWRARLRLRARAAAPLEFDRRDRHAVVEIPARASGKLRRRGRTVARVRDAAGFYEYESTPVTRERDRVPGTVAWLAARVRSAAGAAPPRSAGGAGG
jgi:predicted secreted hydrolase